MQQYWDYICISYTQWTKKKENYPHHLKGQNQNKPEVEVNLKKKPQGHRQNPPKAQEADETYNYDSPNNYYHNDNYTDPSQNRGCRPFNGEGVTDNLEASHKEAEATDLNTINVNFRTIGFSEACINRTVPNTALTTNPICREIEQMTTEDGAVARVLSKSEDAVVVGPITIVIMALTNISIIHMINRWNNMAHPVASAAVSIIPLSTATKENMT